MQLADPYCLAPLFRFRYDHIVTDPETGKAVGYKNLNDIRERLKNTLIRRTKQSVQLQLPKRTDQFLSIPMTPVQQSRHDELENAVAKLVSKWQRTGSLGEEERRRLLLMLGQMRMLADSTYIIDQDGENRHDVKVAELMNILCDALDGGTAKIVIFSEWERMTRIVAAELDAKNIRYECLHGGVPAQKRSELIDRFTNDPDCRIFLSTDAGSTGLNLQAASIIINLDLPWNPAILEQRVGRIYRIGQEMPIQVLSLVSKGSIEEKMIERLRFKRSMFEGALDGGDDTIFLSEERFKGFMSEIAQTLSASPAKTGGQVPFEEKPMQEDVPSGEDAGKNVPSEDTIITFLASLRDILQSPEKTKRLADAITQILNNNQ